MPQRIQRRRVAGWRANDAIYVGRPTVFGNPWKVSHHGGINIDGPGMYFVSADEIDTAHQFAVDLYWSWLTQGNECRALKCRRLDETVEGRDKLEARRRRILGQLPTLAGRDLSCWCTPSFACHADVLLELANA